MMYVSVAVIVLIAVGIAVSRWMPQSGDPAQFGTVSQQWLAEYRASHQE